MKSKSSFNRQPIGVRVSPVPVSETQQVRLRLIVKRRSLRAEQALLANAFGLVVARRHPPRQCWIAAAFVPLMFLAGIMILIETKKGRLVIESEVAGLNVTLLRDGEVYEELKIESGTNSTTLLAGQYKIVVDDAKDILLLDGGKIEIKRGEVVVARVRPDTKTPTDAATENVEPIYDGKPLAEWLRIVASERSPNSVRDALQAVSSLLTAENAKMITERLLQILPTYSKDLAQSRAAIEVANPQPGRTIRYSQSVDELAFSILRTANSRSDFASLLVLELEKGTIDWQRRILKHSSSLVASDGIQELEALLRRQYPNSSLAVIPNQKGCSVTGFVPSGDDVEYILSLAGQYFQPVVNLLTVSNENDNPRASNVTDEPLKSASRQDVMPIVEWIEQKVLNADADDELLYACGDYYWDLINDATTEEAIKLGLLEKLSSCKALGAVFWLDPKRIFDSPQATQYNAPRSTLIPPAKAEIEKQAIAALAGHDGKSPFQVQAAIVLRLLYAQSLDRFALDDSRRIVVEEIKSLLRRLGNSKDELCAPNAIPSSLLRSTAMVDEINRQNRLELLKPAGDLRQNISWTIMRFSPAQSFLTVELLELVRVLNASAECSPELLKLYMATAELNKELNAILDSNPVTQATWPGMSTSPTSTATTDHWMAGIIRIRAFRLLAPETQAELTQLANRTFKSQAFESLLNKYDANKDGILSVKEADGMAESIEKFDLNQDGKLDGWELNSRSNTPAFQVDMARFEALAGQGNLGGNLDLEWSKKQVDKYDKNKDGKLTVDEWSSMLTKPDGADANGDGVITVEEYSDFRMKRRRP